MVVVLVDIVVNVMIVTKIANGFKIWLVVIIKIDGCIVVEVNHAHVVVDRAEI